MCFNNILYYLFDIPPIPVYVPCEEIVVIDPKLPTLPTTSSSYIKPLSPRLEDRRAAKFKKKNEDEPEYDIVDLP